MIRRYLTHYRLFVWKSCLTLVIYKSNNQGPAGYIQHTGSVAICSIVPAYPPWPGWDISHVVECEELGSEEFSEKVRIKGYLQTLVRICSISCFTSSVCEASQCSYNLAFPSIVYTEELAFQKLKNRIIISLRKKNKVTEKLDIFWQRIPKKNELHTTK